MKFFVFNMNSSMEIAEYDSCIFEKYTSKIKLDSSIIDWVQILLQFDKEFIIKNAEVIEKYVQDGHKNWATNFASHKLDENLTRCVKCNATKIFQFNCEALIMEKVLK